MNLAMNASQLPLVPPFESLEVNAPLQHTFARQSHNQLYPQLRDNILRCIVVRTLGFNSATHGAFAFPSGWLMFEVQATLISVPNMRLELERGADMSRGICGGGTSRKTTVKIQG